MNLKSVKSTMTGTAVGLAMMLGITIATAQAQYRYDNNGRSYGDSWPRERTTDYAFKLGYHQAYSEAAEARDNGFRGSGRDLPGYRNDGNGYLSYMNYEQDYRNAYRRGFESGAQDAFSRRERRYGRDEVEAVLGQRLKDAYPANGGYSDHPDFQDDPRDWRGNDRRGKGGWNDRNNDWQNVNAIAQQRGYQDGLRRGQQDRSRRLRFDYQSSNEYRDALNGYRFEFGNQNRYRDAYREGFRRGYTEGFRDSRERWRS